MALAESQNLAKTLYTVLDLAEDLVRIDAIELTEDQSSIMVKDLYLVVGQNLKNALTLLDLIPNSSVHVLDKYDLSSEDANYTRPITIPEQKKVNYDEVPTKSPFTSQIDTASTYSTANISPAITHPIPINKGDIESQKDSEM